MEERKVGWMAFSKLIGKDSKFKPCPLCGGEIIHGRQSGTLSLVSDPECQDCKTQFRPHKKYHLFKGFDIIHRK